MDFTLHTVNMATHCHTFLLGQVTYDPQHPSTGGYSLRKLLLLLLAVPL